ncbi:hypothetical protein GQ600_19054 [Phytophthora cactorum]|nr:hypothetical protein GQ600_19054 [Phytophthora cactorum]
MIIRLSSLSRIQAPSRRRSRSTSDPQHAQGNTSHPRQHQHRQPNPLLSASSPLLSPESGKGAVGNYGDVTENREEVDFIGSSVEARLASLTARIEWIGSFQTGWRQREAPKRTQQWKNSTLERSFRRSVCRIWSFNVLEMEKTSLCRYRVGTESLDMATSGSPVKQFLHSGYYHESAVDCHRSVLVSPDLLLIRPPSNRILSLREYMAQGLDSSLLYCYASLMALNAFVAFYHIQFRWNESTLHHILKDSIVDAAFAVFFPALILLYSLFVFQDDLKSVKIRQQFFPPRGFERKARTW